MKNRIPYGKQTIGAEEIRAVTRALKSPRITQGPLVQEFEDRLADYCGAKYAVAVCNGTAALHLAYLALGLKAKTNLVTTPLTFSATAAGAVYCGAGVKFADISPETLNLDAENADEAADARTKIFAPVHFAGYPCDMEKIKKAAVKNKSAIVEDACHALGASYRTGSRWVKVGSATHADACIFSFHPVKAITTGEGGAITTNRRDIYEKLLVLRSHGMVKKENWLYEISQIGFNYRITDIQCAMGIVQLKRLDSFIQKRRQIANFYNRALKDVPEVELPPAEDGVKAAYHLYVLRFNLEKLIVDRGVIFEELKKLGIDPQVHYIPLHTQPAYRKFGYGPGDFSAAENYYRSALSIPIYPDLKNSERQYVVNAVKKIILRFRKRRSQ